MSTKRKQKNKRPMPLAPPPAMRSRKKARVVTSLFHRYTRELDEAKRKNKTETVMELEGKLKEIGGREAYQQASQLSTSFFSTSKWVLGHLARSGWLYGIHEDKKSRRMLQLLEVGAINTELLDAAKQTKQLEDGTIVPKYRLSTRAIDLRSTHDGIEEADFLTFPLNNYDVVVCSMVINCVPRPEHRGLMLARLYHQLAPGGLCFLTLPRLCLHQSPYMSMEHFKDLLSETGVGFVVEETKESPKVAFFVLRRPMEEDVSDEKFDKQWTMSKVKNKGKKFRNFFDVTLRKEEVDGTGLTR
jgi:25S rRNA (adenine2142-N1)-methyltransferase